jgi:hypothetical protein
VLGGEQYRVAAARVAAEIQDLPPVERFLADL